MGKYPDHLVETLIDSSDNAEILAAMKAIKKLRTERVFNLEYIRLQPDWSIFRDSEDSAWVVLKGELHRIDRTPYPRRWEASIPKPLTQVLRVKGGTE